MKEEQTHLKAVSQPDLIEGRQVGASQPILTREHIGSLAPWGDPKGQEEPARSFPTNPHIDPSHGPLTLSTHPTLLTDPL